MPRIIARRGSPIVTVWRSSKRFIIHHEPASFWFNGGDSMVRVEEVGSTYRDLDVRTCQASLKWSRGPADDTPAAEEGMIGPVRFSADAARTNLVALDTATGRTWTAASGFGGILSVTAVPAARRIVVVTGAATILVYDVDANRVVSCL
jgi:hypothetical protein